MCNKNSNVVRTTNLFRPGGFAFCFPSFFSFRIQNYAAISYMYFFFLDDKSLSLARYLTLQ